MYRTNKEIRQKAHESGVYLWEIAEALRYSPSRFTERLHREFTPEMKCIIGTVIHEIVLKHQAKPYTDPEVLRKAAEDFRREVQKCQGQSCRKK